MHYSAIVGSAPNFHRQNYNTNGIRNTDELSAKSQWSGSVARIKRKNSGYLLLAVTDDRGGM